MMRDLSGLRIATLGSVLLLGACQRIGNKDGAGSQAPATSGSVPAGPAIAVAATSTAPATTASSVVPAAAPGTTAGQRDYALEGLGELAPDCVEPAVVLMAVPKDFYSSDTFDWRHVRQVALANPEFEIVRALALNSKPTSIAFTENEHKPTKGVALVAHCKTSATCLRFAAAYRTVVASAAPTPICGPNPNIGPRIAGGKSVLPATGSISGVLPEKKDAQSQCVRLAACKAAKAHVLASDETQECMKKPGNFKRHCSLKQTCDEVLACVGE